MVDNKHTIEFLQARSPFYGGYRGIFININLYVQPRACQHSEPQEVPICEFSDSLGKYNSSVPCRQEPQVVQGS